MTTRSASLERLWRIEALEERVLLSGVMDAFGVKKAKFVDDDGDKVNIKLKKGTFDITYDFDGMGNVTNVDTLTIQSSQPNSILSFKIKPAKGGLSDGTFAIDSIVSGGPGIGLGGINAFNVSIGNLALSGGLSGSFATNMDFGSATFTGHLESFIIQGGNDLLGDLVVDSLGRFSAVGGNILGSITTTTFLGSVEAANLSGTITAGTTFDRLNLTGDLSGDVSFTKGTLEVLIGGNVTDTGSIVANDPTGDAHIDAGSFSRLGVIGNFAGTVSADGTLGLGVGGNLTSTASVSSGGNLTVKANSIAADLTSTGGDIAFAMTTGGFAGTINAANDVKGNGNDDGIVIRGGNFSGSITAGNDVYAMSFLPSSGGFTGSVTAGGTVMGITTNFFSSTASVTGADIGNLTANRVDAGDAIAAGATFTATTGSIGNVTANALASIAIGGTFTAADSIGNITAISNGNTSADHAISGATFIATAGAIGTVDATAKAGSGINDSTFTAATGIGDMTATSVSGHGFRASAGGLNLFTVTNGSLANISGTSLIGDGIHGGAFVASDNIGIITGVSSTGNGIGDATGAVTTSFTATSGSISSITGRATGGAPGSGGDGIVNTEVFANEDADGIGIETIEGESEFGTGIAGSRFSIEGDVTLISGSTNNTNPTVDQDGIFDSVFRTAGSIGSVVATTGLAGGAGVGSAIENSLFSAAGSIGSESLTAAAGLSSISTSPSTSGSNGKNIGPNFSANTIRIDNDVPLGTAGHWDVDVESGGESRDAQLTAMRFASGDVVTENVLFDYFSYVDVGNNGSGFQLGGSDPVNVDGDPDKVNSTGSFTGSGGNTINWSVDSFIEDGGSVMFNVFTFTAQSGTLGTMRFLQYLDEDIEGVSDDVLITRGTVADGTLELFTIDNDEVYGVSHGGSLNTAQGLVNATFAGWAADEYNDMKPRITGSGQPVSPDGVIDFSSLPQFEHPQLGTAFGPADIVSVMAWDVDPNETSATIITTLGGVPDASALSEFAITTTGDVVDSVFLAGYDIADFSLDGTGADPSELASTDPVQINGIRVNGDWINSFAAAGITTTNSTIGDGDDALSAPGSVIGSVTVTSNIAGITGGVATNNFQSDAIDDISADAIGIDPNSGSALAPVGFFTDFSNGELGSIGDITANTSTQQQAIGDGTLFLAGASIESVSALNENTSFNELVAIGDATFEAGTYIGNIRAATPFAPAGTAITAAVFIAHANNPETGLAIGNISVNVGFEEGMVTATGMAGTEFDASDPTVPGTPLNIGTVEVFGDVGVDDSFDFAPVSFTATGDIGRGVRFVTPTHVTAVDLNADENLDLVVVNEGSDQVLVSLGNGDGTFATPVAYPAGDAPLQTVISDVNNDSVLDIVVLNSVPDPASEDTISLLIGNGDGTFDFAGSIPIGTMSAPTGIAVGDWIGDGNPDLAITDGATGTVTILKGLGDGNFEEAAVTDLPAGTTPSDVVVTAATGKASPPPISFNGDGYIDMAVTNFDSDNVSIFLGNVGENGAGTGTWSAATNFSVGDGPSALAIGSLNSTINNSLDLAVTNQFANTVSVLLGTGTGSFGAATDFAVGTNPVDVALADVNEDGRLDIITANSSSNDISVLLGDGLGSFGAATNFAVGVNPVSLSTGDFDKDGFIDVVVADRDSGALTTLFGDGTGNFALRNIFSGPDVFGIRVTGNIAGSEFIADSDENGSGSLAGIGGIQLLRSEEPKKGFDPCTASVLGEIEGHIYGCLASPTFQGGSNDATSGLAIGNVTAAGANLVTPSGIVVLHGIDSATFRTVPTVPDLNIGAMTTTLGSIGSFPGPATTVTATGHIFDITSAVKISSGSVFLADSDLDGDGDVGAITAAGIEDASFTGNNVALDNTITVSESIDGMSVVATTGSIGDLLVSQDEGNAVGEGAANVNFTAAVNIGDIAIRYTKPAPGEDATVTKDVLKDSTFLAAQADPTGRIGEVRVENIIDLNDGVLVTGSSFVAGTGGIGDITAETAGLGNGIVGSSFRTTGAPDATNRANIGNITVVTNPIDDFPNDGVVNSVFSAMGSIGVGAGNENGFHIDITGSVQSSRFLAGFDIGSDLTIGTGDDVLSSAISFINKVSVSGLFIASDLVAGVDPGNDRFGDAGDTAAVVGSSIGSVELGTVTLANDVVLGEFVAENPLADRMHAIAADLIGSIKIGDTEHVGNLPGYLDNGGGVHDVNIKVL